MLELKLDIRLRPPSGPILLFSSVLTLFGSPEPFLVGISYAPIPPLRFFQHQSKP